MTTRGCGHLGEALQLLGLVPDDVEIADDLLDQRPGRHAAPAMLERREIGGADAERRRHLLLADAALARAARAALRRTASWPSSRAGAGGRRARRRRHGGARPPRSRRRAARNGGVASQSGTARRSTPSPPRRRALAGDDQHVARRRRHAPARRKDSSSAMGLVLGHAVQVDAAVDRQPALGAACRASADRAAAEQLAAASALAGAAARRLARRCALRRGSAGGSAAGSGHVDRRRGPAAARPCARPGSTERGPRRSGRAVAPAHRAPSTSARGTSAKKSAGVAHDAGDLARRVAGADEEVAARRADDGRAGVLRDHQAPERRRRRSGSVGASMKNGRAEGVQQAVDGDASGPASAAPWRRRSDRAPDRRPPPRGRRCRSGCGQQDLVDAVGMRGEPGADRLHRRPRPAAARPVRPASRPMAVKAGRILAA